MIETIEDYKEEFLKFKRKVGVRQRNTLIEGDDNGS